MLVSGGEKHLTSNTESILELENWEHGDNGTENANLGTGRKGKGTN